MTSDDKLRRLREWCKECRRCTVRVGGAIGVREFVDYEEVIVEIDRLLAEPASEPALLNDVILLPKMVRLAEAYLDLRRATKKALKALPSYSRAKQDLEAALNADK